MKALQLNTVWNAAEYGMEFSYCLLDFEEHNISRFPPTLGGTFGG